MDSAMERVTEMGCESIPTDLATHAEAIVLELQDDESVIDMYQRESDVKQWENRFFESLVDKLIRNCDICGPMDIPKLILDDMMLMYDEMCCAMHELNLN